MEAQNFKNHPRLVLGYHQIGLTSAFTVFVWSVINLISDFSSNTLFLCLFAFSFNLIAFYVRNFAAGNQDRIIRMEMRYNYHLLTGIRFETFENQLTIKQIVALRFASDDEIVELVNRAIANKMTPKEIKLAIKNWKADHQRI